MKKNNVIMSSFLTAVTLTTCMGLCSCSPPSSSVNPDDFVASFVSGSNETTVTTGLTSGDSAIEFVDTGFGRAKFEDVDDGIVSVGNTQEKDVDSEVASTDEAEGTQSVFYVEETVEEETEYIEESVQAEDASTPANASEDIAPAEEIQSTPATVQDTTVSTSAPAPSASTPAASAPATPAPVASTPSPAQRQLSEEEQLAREIFNAYNDYRASRGLGRVSWSDSCASMATSSASGCASRQTLTHRLGIPSNLQGSYSDVLQYASWKMSGSEAVNNWINSTGHRKQMQCGSATEAGVGVVRASNGYWYIALVYNFSGSNQGGN